MFRHRLYINFKLKYIYLILLSSLYVYPSYSNELIVREIQNQIKIVDKYGNKFLLDKNYILKSGDFLNSVDKSSYLIFDKTKLCLGKNSSIKIKQLKSNLITIKHLKGSLLINNGETNKLNFKIELFDNLISNFKNKIYTKQIDKKKFILKSFSSAKFKPNYSQNVINIKQNTTYLFDQILQKKLVTNISQSPLIKNCITNKKNIETNRQKLFKCKPNFSKLICGFQ